MSTAATIKTSGQLREFLVNMMLGVKNNQIEPTKANVINKMAAQVNESFYSEAKVAKLQVELGKQASSLGELPINK